VNVFIGRPNAGKSNILESLGLLSWAHYARFGGSNLVRRFVRHERPSNLFYDELLDRIIEIKADSLLLDFGFASGRFEGKYREGDEGLAQLFGDYQNLSMSAIGRAPTESVNFYRFETLQTSRFERHESEFLLPPTGENLLAVTLHRKEVKSMARKLLDDFGLKFVLKPQEFRIEIFKEEEDVITSLPYLLLSDTLQRIHFYMAAILANKNSVNVFEEPDSHTFPYYAKYLAEAIGLDSRGNQYFISTHNPYFLEPLLEKTPKEQIAVFFTYSEDYETKTRLLSEKDLEKLIEVDVFLNLDSLLEN
jgi:AAA15 family ATPase/GTPase